MFSFERYTFVLLKYDNSGRVAKVIIKEERNPDDIRTLNKVKLELFGERSGHVLVIKVAGEEVLVIVSNSIVI